MNIKMTSLPSQFSSPINAFIIFLNFHSIFGADPYFQPKLKIPANYIKESRPTALPVEISVSLFVEAINPIKAADMDIRMKLFMYQSWVDKRLNFSQDLFIDSDHIVLPYEYFDQIWRPDPNIANSKSIDIGQLTKKMQSIYIFRNHTVLYSINFFATLACTFQFQFYPYDFQICPYYIESFSHDENKIKYIWAKYNPLMITPKLVRMLQYGVTRPLHFKTESVTRIRDEDKRFTRLTAFFRFDRLLGNHIIQTFSPCSLIISLSWFSFWLDLDAISARVSVLVTSLLTLVTQFSGLKLDFPPVAYIKAVDIWMAGCMVFIFGALMEFVIVKTLHGITDEERKNLFQNDDKSTPITRSNKDRKSNEVLEQNENVGESRLNSGKEDIEEKKERFHLSKFAVPDDVMFAMEELKKSRDESNGSNKTITINDSAKSYHVDHQIMNFKIHLIWIDGKGRKRVLWKEIDYFSRIIFPALFCIFSALYWLILHIHYKIYS